MRIALKYSFFAAIATIVNLVTQESTLRFYHGAKQVTVSILFGTATGLLVKYVLDKKYIFQFKPKNVQHDSKTFFLYCLMGLVTTAIFWGFEGGFEYFFHDKTLRFVGAIIGLAIGYVIKYFLDKKLVFTASKN